MSRMANTPDPTLTGSLDEGRFAYLESKYNGKLVSVYCSNGSRLTGVARFIPDRWIEVSQEGERAAVCNLDFVISIALK